MIKLLKNIIFHFDSDAMHVQILSGGGHFQRRVLLHSFQWYWRILVKSRRQLTMITEYTMHDFSAFTCLSVSFCLFSSDVWSRLHHFLFLIQLVCAHTLRKWVSNLCICLCAYTCVCVCTHYWCFTFPSGPSDSPCFHRFLLCDITHFLFNLWTLQKKSTIQRNRWK